MMTITQHLVWGEAELETLVLIQSPHSASLSQVPSISIEICWKLTPFPEFRKFQIVVILVLHLWSQSWTLSPQSWFMRPQIQPQAQIEKNPDLVFC